MSTLVLERAWHRELTAATAQLTGGTYVVLGGPSDGAAALIELASGLVAPSAGTVLLEGKAPFADPDTRRRIAALRAEEQLPPLKTVSAALALLLGARGDTRSAASVLDEAALANLGSRQVRTLAARETRAIFLALALTQPEPLLLALFEPLTLLGLVHEAYLRESLARCSSAGAVVLTTASRLEDAAVIEGTLSVLERGTWLGSSAARVQLEAAALRVQTPDAERLATLLPVGEDVTSLEALGDRELIVRGPELERIAQRVLRAAEEAALTIEAMRVDAASLSELRAARERAARAAQAALRARAARPIFYGPGPIE